MCERIGDERANQASRSKESEMNRNREEDYAAVHEIRVMRQKIAKTAFGGDRLDGKPAPGYLMSNASSLAKAVLNDAEYRGLSGEDAMTALAFHALIKYEEAMDRLLNIARNNTDKVFIVGKPAGDHV
jgi:hypothetical protein